MKHVESETADEQPVGNWFTGDWFAPWWFALLAGLSLIAGIGGFIEDTIRSRLTRGPQFQAGQAPGRIDIVVPTELDSFALRLGWNLSVAMVFLGVAVLMFTFGQVGSRVPATPLFSEQIKRLAWIRFWIVVGLFILSAAMQGLLRGAIADAAELPDADPQLSGVLDFLPGSLIWIPLSLGWLFKQGAAVQAETEDIV